MKNKFVILIFCFLSISLQAQKSSNFRIGVEMGFMTTDGAINEPWEFREIGYRSDQYIDDQYINGNFNMNHVGIKAELSAWKNRLTFSSGLRYTYVDELINAFNNRPLYLFLPSNDQIDLFRLNQIYESQGYIGVPFEIDAVLIGLTSNWQIYIKTGLQGGVKVYEKRGFDFFSKELKINEDELITAHWKKPSIFFVNTYLNFGIRLILKKGIRISSELLFPPSYLSKNNYMLINPRAEMGMRVMVTMPVNFSLSGKKINQ